jgi:hypothetical protein
LSKDFVKSYMWDPKAVSCPGLASPMEVYSPYHEPP